MSRPENGIVEPALEERGEMASLDRNVIRAERDSRRSFEQPGLRY
jgi:hypothetical protein